MHQEDLLSQQREREDRDRAQKRRERLEFLKYIYTPYRSIFMDDDFEAALWDGPYSYRWVGRWTEEDYYYCCYYYYYHHFYSGNEH